MIGFIIGIALGIVYFGGLYFSIQKMTKAKYPSLIMTLSFILRMAILVGVFFYLSKGGYQDMLFGLLGVLLVRIIMTFMMKEQNPNSVKKR